MTDTVRLAVGPMVLADWRSRALALLADPNAANPWAKYVDATGVGSADLTLDELDEVIAQALDVVDDPNPSEPGLVTAYDRVLRKATRARVDLARPSITALDLAEAIDRTTPATAAPAGDNRVTVWTSLAGPRTTVIITPGRLAWGTDLAEDLPFTGNDVDDIAARLITRLTTGA